MATCRSWHHLHIGFVIDKVIAIANNNLKQGWIRSIMLLRRSRKNVNDGLKQNSGMLQLIQHSKSCRAEINGGSGLGHMQSFRSNPSYWISNIANRPSRPKIDVINMCQFVNYVMLWNQREHSVSTCQFQYGLRYRVIDLQMFHQSMHMQIICFIWKNYIWVQSFNKE